jgi:predicted nucleotidyltransferase
MSPDPQVLAELVEGIVETAHPERIILFGSAVRGEMGPDSDLDILVVVSDQTDNCLSLAQAIYQRLRDLQYPKDILVVKASDFQRHRDNPYLIYHTAVTTGKELFRAAS